MATTPSEGPERIIVAITGASGAIYGIRSLTLLREVPDLEIHLIVTAGARACIAYETSTSLSEVLSLAHVVHNEKRSRVLDFERIVPQCGHAHRAVQHQDTGGHRQLVRLQPRRARSRRCPQGEASPRPVAARDTACMPRTFG